MNKDKKETKPLLSPKAKPKNPFVNTQESTLQWSQISLSINSQKILQDLSGFSNPKEILAIMGSSGCGKTSFLSALSNNIPNNKSVEQSGEILINSSKVDNKKLNSLIGFVSQEPVFYDFFTPYEFLLFTLRIKSSEPLKAIKERVELILDQFNLTEVKHTVIGNTMLKGLSGGEKKRVFIAAEILMCPSILILDEPTSGLDSFIAKKVMDSLKELANGGVNVIITIHQPGFEVFKMFNRLILMQEGRFVYQGLAGDSVEYFKKIGFCLPRGINPPDYYMKMLYVSDRKNLSREEQEKIGKLLDYYRLSQSELWKGMEVSVEKDDFNEKSISFFRSLRLLVWREFLSHKRNPFLTKIKIMQCLAYTLLTILIFNNLTFDNKGVENRRGFMSLILFTFCALQSYTITMSVAFEKPVVLREFKQNLYSINSYYLTKLILELPVIIICSLFIVFTVYYLADLNQESSSKVFIFLLIGFMLQMQGSIFGLFNGSIAPFPVAAATISSTFQTTFMLFAGYFNNPEIGPEATNWIKYLCFQFYYRNAALKNEFDDLDIDFDVRPDPEERFGITGEIETNLLIGAVYAVVVYFCAYLVYRYLIYKTSVRE